MLTSFLQKRGGGACLQSSATQSLQSTQCSLLKTKRSTPAQLGKAELSTCCTNTYGYCCLKKNREHILKVPLVKNLASIVDGKKVEPLDILSVTRAHSAFALSNCSVPSQVSDFACYASLTIGSRGGRGTRESWPLPTVETKANGGTYGVEMKGVLPWLVFVGLIVQVQEFFL